jgi:hypothetical protein
MKSFSICSGVFLMSSPFCRLYTSGPGATPKSLSIRDVRAFKAAPTELANLVLECLSLRTQGSVWIEPVALALSEAEMDGKKREDVAEAVRINIEKAADHDAMELLLDALPLCTQKDGSLKKIGEEVLAEVKALGRPSTPTLDSSEVLGDTAQIEACKERLRPVCCLVQCLPRREWRFPRCLRCQGNALVLWASLVCSLLCSLLCQRRQCPRRCQCLNSLLQQQQYELHMREDPEASVRDPFFCVGDYSVALQPPSLMSKLSKNAAHCCCQRRSAAAAPTLGSEIDHLHLVEGLLTVHCFRTIELALLMVLACAIVLGSAFFFAVQYLIRRGLVPAQSVAAAAELTHCPQGIPVLGAPLALSCFQGDAHVDPGAALGFAQAIAASGGALTLNTSLLAASACAPVLDSLTSVVSVFTVPGLIQRIFRYSQPNVTIIHPEAQWLFAAWSLVPLAVLLSLDFFACDKRSPVPRKADSLRLLYTAEAREFMMCVSSHPFMQPLPGHYLE